MPNNAGAKKNIFNFSLFKRVISLTVPYKKVVFYSIFIAITLAIIAPVRPAIIQWIMKYGFKNDVAIFSIIGIVQVGLLVLGFQILLLCIETFLRFLFGYITAQLGQNVINDLRQKIFKKILNLNLKQFDTTPVGTLTTRTINDVESINEVFSDGFIPILADLLTIISLLIYMFYINFWLSLMALLPFPFLIWGTYIFKETVNKSFIKVRNAVSQLNAFVQERLSGIHLIQSFAIENAEFKKFEKINSHHRDANVKAIFAYSVFFPFVELILAISVGLLVWWAGTKQDANMAGLITAFILCINQLFRPLRVIADKFNVLQMGMIAGERIFKVLDNEDTSKDDGILEMKNDGGKIIFNNVNFAYQNDKYVLKNISFEIPPHTSLALVGHTGSGKSSVIGLLNRLYQYQSGTISIDGIPIEKIKLSSLRKNIAVVLQDIFLFNGTVFENITLNDVNVNIDTVKQACIYLGIHDFIMQLPNNYFFNIKERGNTLSHGQKQLISFARALIQNPEIIILDEATASIDSESEQLVQHALEILLKNRTAIIIAHRLSTIAQANQIIVLKNGQIIERGNHESLLQLKGNYYNMQTETNK